MIRIAVIDDEPKIRRGIAGMLEASLKGRAAVSRFSDAGELIRFARKEELHILVTDICMPDIDGLELGNYLKMFYPRLRIIIISGYNNFEYAQTAIRLQVSEYLLKPVDPGKLLEVVNKLIESIGQEEILSAKGTKKGGEEKPKRDRLIREMLYGGDSEHPALQGFADGKTAYYLVLTEGEKELCLDMVRLSLQSGRIDGGRNFYLIMEEGHLARIKELYESGMENKGSAGSEGEEGAGSDGDEDAGTGGAGSRNVGISGGCYSADMLHQAYLQAWSALKQELYEERPGVWSFQNTGIWQFDGEKKALYILNCVYAGTDYMRELSEVREEIRSARPVFPMYERNMKVMLHAMIKMLEESKRLSGECLALKHIAEGMDAYRSLNRMFEEIGNVLGQAAENAREIQGIRTENHIHRAIDYIQGHYCEDLTLEEVAARADMNPAYFSSSFKKYTGSSFIHYMMELRIRRAKELLKEGRKISEISNLLGFHDTRYFTRTFKKYVGVTPSEYKNITGMLYEDQ